MVQSKFDACNLHKQELMRLNAEAWSHLTSLPNTYFLKAIFITYGKMGGGSTE